MIVNGLSDEELAKIFAHYVYRDTDVEDYHSKAVLMDDTLFASVYRIVSSNLLKIARNHNLLISVKLEELDSTLESMYPTRAMEFLKYAQMFSNYCSFKPGLNWNAPVFMERKPSKDKAKFLLEGAFREGCTLHWIFNDEAMCRINKDVYNRTYTLVLLGLLPPPRRHSIVNT